MKPAKIIERTLQLLLVYLFAAFIAVPALVESPKVAYAEAKKTSLEKRAAARKKSALRLINKALKEKDEEKKQAMIEDIAAQCSADSGDYPCPNDPSLVVDKVTDCSLCDGPGCLSCCDNLAGGRAGMCKREICNAGGGL